MNGARVFLVGGRLAHRALFNWHHPGVYIPTMLGAPALQIIFFAYLGRWTGQADDSFFVVGNALATSAMAGIFGVVMSIGNERQFGTLQYVLATPARRVAIFHGRAVVSAVHGVAVCAFGLAVGWLVLDVRIEPATLPALAVAVVVAATSCAAFGVALGAVCLRANDIWVGTNLAYAVVLLLCGANVPPAHLPTWLAGAGQALPLSHGIDAARRLAAGSALADVAGSIGNEALVGLGYAVLGYGLLRLVEAESRQRSTLGRS
jgi:ABC-2 type transport system permease protein